MLYKAVLLLAMALLPQTEAFTLSAPQGAIAACRAPAAAIESKCTCHAAWHRKAQQQAAVTAHFRDPICLRAKASRR